MLTDYDCAQKARRIARFVEHQLAHAQFETTNQEQRQFLADWRWAVARLAEATDRLAGSYERADNLRRQLEDLI